MMSKSREPSECCPVNLLMSVDFPTDGKPIKPLLRVSMLDSNLTRQHLHTSDTSPCHIETNCCPCELLDSILISTEGAIPPPPPPPPEGVSSSFFSFASFAFSCPTGFVSQGAGVVCARVSMHTQMERSRLVFLRPSHLHGVSDALS